MRFRNELRTAPDRSSANLLPLLWHPHRRWSLLMARGIRPLLTIRSRTLSRIAGAEKSGKLPRMDATMESEEQEPCCS